MNYNCVYASSMNLDFFNRYFNNLFDEMHTYGILNQPVDLLHTPGRSIFEGDQL
jgi:hypothetical protein